MTESRRITVTFAAETHELVREMADLNNTSMSKIVAELIDTMVPTLQRVIDAGRHFQALSDEMKERIQGNFAAAEATVLPVVQEMEQEFLALLESVSDAAKQEENPRRVTRGSRPSNLSTPTDEENPETENRTDAV